MELFNSFNWDVKLKEERGETVRVTLQHKSTMSCCPICSVFLIVKFGVRKATYVDLPAMGKRMVLNVIRQRYRCTDCQKTFLESTPFLNDEHRLTQRAVDYIQQQSTARTHSDIARELGVDGKTVWNVFAAHVETFQSLHEIITPEVLGIDEIFALGRARCVLTNIRENTVLDGQKQIQASRQENEDFGLAGQDAGAGPS